ncbi:hypothetical protein [Ruegeria arenilitoris]|uniref:hypothetical protein n=1 Tax=Ruegeria arenilitoris TaxID=1173585 RepID=UPI001480AA75|nr:hypothetical protein [Ruegeria arenilitoris]
MSQITWQGKQHTQSETEEFYLDVIRRAGGERIEDLAFQVLWLIRKEPFQDLTGDYFRWPYDWDKSEFSLVDEMIWVMHESGHELFEDNYRPAYRPVCKQLVAQLRNGEEDLLSVAVCEDIDRDMTHFERLELVEREIENEVLRLVKRLDRQVLDEEFLARGFRH